MDPDKVLADILAVIEEREGRTSDFDDLAERFRDLHQWLQNGGYKPKAWAGRGVNLEKVPSEEFEGEVRRIQELLRQNGTALVSRTPSVIVASDVANGADDVVYACLAIEYAESNSPVEAVQILRKRLEHMVNEPKGQA